MLGRNLAVLFESDYVTAPRLLPFQLFHPTPVSGLALLAVFPAFRHMHAPKWKFAKLNSWLSTTNVMQSIPHVKSPLHGSSRPLQELTRILRLPCRALLALLARPAFAVGFPPNLAALRFAITLSHPLPLPPSRRPLCPGPAAARAVSHVSNSSESRLIRPPTCPAACSRSSSVGRPAIEPRRPCSV